jgi:hypothetical protein
MYDLMATPQLVGAPTIHDSFDAFNTTVGFHGNAEHEFSATTFEWDVAPAVNEVESTKASSAVATKNAGKVEVNPSKATAKRKRRSTPPKKTNVLPEDFQPSHYSVLCGKGSENYNAVGKLTACSTIPFIFTFKVSFLTCSLLS